MSPADNPLKWKPDALARDTLWLIAAVLVAVGIIALAAFFPFATPHFQNNAVKPPPLIRN